MKTYKKIDYNMARAKEQLARQYPDEIHNVGGDCVNPKCDYSFTDGDRKDIDYNYGYFSCPKCGTTHNYMDSGDEPGGWTHSGLSLDEMGAIGEKLVDRLGYIPGVGQITDSFTHIKQHPVDAHIGPYAVEIKTNHSQAQPRFKISGRSQNRQEKIDYANQNGMQPGLLGVRLNFHNDNADLYFRPAYTDTWIGNPELQHVGTYNFADLNPYKHPEDVPPASEMPEDDDDLGIPKASMAERSGDLQYPDLTEDDWEDIGCESYAEMVNDLNPGLRLTHGWTRLPGGEWGQHAWNTTPRGKIVDDFYQRSPGWKPEVQQAALSGQLEYHEGDHPETGKSPFGGAYDDPYIEQAERVPQPFENGRWPTKWELFRDKTGMAERSGDPQLDSQSKTAWYVPAIDAAGNTSRNDTPYWAFRWGYYKGRFEFEDKDYNSNTHYDMVEKFGLDPYHEDPGLEDVWDSLGKESWFGYGVLDTNTGNVIVEPSSYDLGEQDDTPPIILELVKEKLQTNGFSVKHADFGSVGIAY